MSNPPHNKQTQRAYVFTTASGCGKTRGLFEIEPALREIEDMPKCWSVYVGFNCTFGIREAENWLLLNTTESNKEYSASCILLNRLYMTIRLRCSGKKHSELPDD
eukprot:PhF_6_TR8069/c0_g1_i1/m.12485